MAGLGVRLVRRDKQLVALDCTDYMIQIDRNVRTFPIPFTGERFGGDINQVMTSIRLNCVIRDDDCAQTNAETTAATAAIDFSQTIANFQITDDFNEITPITRERFATLAALLKARINSNSTFAALFSAEVEASLRDTGSEKSRLVLTNVNKGGMGDITQSPIYTASGTTKQPTISLFSGGEAQDCFSAGDKVQNLIGSVINNTILGAVGGTDIGVANIQGNFDVMGTTDSDYIVGLQLPYNSFSDSIVGATAVSTPQSYTGKNFIYATGIGNKSKDAASNTQNSSIEFDPRSKYTGIRGTVTSLEFKYNAGDTTYDATLTFQPLDLIAGV